MELGNFLGKLKGQDIQPVKNFLALILTDEVVQSSVWSVVNQQTQIIAIGTPVEWDGDTGTTGELITAVDATISSAVEGLENEPSEVILGIPYSWTDKDGILGAKKEFIGKIRQELELQAIGYVVITDSVLSYLKMQEGTPPTSIMIQVSRDELTLVLVRLGHIDSIETIGRSDDIVDDVTEGISRFNSQENLPSRLILFNSMHDLNDLIQNLLSVNWPSQFNFLHLPKIEALPKDVAIRALSVAGGTEVAKSLGIALSPQPTKVVVEDPTPTKSESPDPTDESEVFDLLTAEEIGFTSPSEPNADPADNPEPTDSTIVKKSLTLPSIHFPKFNLPKPKINLASIGHHWYLLGGSILALGLLLFYLVWIMPHALITVQVIPKTLDQEVEITLSTTDSDINFADHVVPAMIDSVTQSGEKIVETTGKKIVGEPATGQVTIYNRTSSAKTFTKGTTLATGSLKFTLDSDLTVASKSAGLDYVDVPGKANVGITASSIGQESNLTSNTELTVSNFGKDSYVAKTDSPLKGGTSEEVQVVSKDDQTELVKALTSEILEQIKANVLAGNASGRGVYLIEPSTTIEDVTYSAKVGEIAKSLSASLTIKTTLLRYQTDDVTTLVNSAIDQAIPPGFVRSTLPSAVELVASDISEDETQVAGTAQVKVSLLPLIDHPQTLSLLKGKRIIEITEILSQFIPGYISTELQFTPAGLPAKIMRIPYNSRNIQLNVAPATL